MHMLIYLCMHIAYIHITSIYIMYADLHLYKVRILDLLYNTHGTYTTIDIVNHQTNPIFNETLRFNEDNIHIVDLLIQNPVDATCIMQRHQ